MAFSVIATTVDDLLRYSYEELGKWGAPVAASRGSTFEVVGATLELENPRARLSRSESRRRLISGLAELTWYLSGSSDPAAIVHYVPAYSKEIEVDGTIHGAYGPRIFGENGNNQIRNVIELLRKSPNTRRAVVQIFDKLDINADRRFLDIPCTTTMQFILREGRLTLIVNMRSNDAYLGLPHDIFVFTMIQEIVARSLGVDLGRYIHLVGSLHFYEDRLQDVKSFMGEGWQSSDAQMEPMPDGDPWVHVAEFSKAERKLRQLGKIDVSDLPSASYWADLVHVLAHREAIKQENSMLAGEVRSLIKDENLREFLPVGEV